jgi:hypothetical protein
LELWLEASTLWTWSWSLKLQLHELGASTFVSELYFLQPLAQSFSSWSFGSFDLELWSLKLLQASQLPCLTSFWTKFSQRKSNKKNENKVQGSHIEGEDKLAKLSVNHLQLLDFTCRVYLFYLLIYVYVYLHKYLPTLHTTYVCPWGNIGMSCVWSTTVLGPIQH